MTDPGRLCKRMNLEVQVLFTRSLLLQEKPPSICLSEHFTKGEEELFNQCVSWAKEEKFKEELLAQCFTKAQEEKLLSEHFPRT